MVHVYGRPIIQCMKINASNSAINNCKSVLNLKKKYNDSNNNNVDKENDDNQNFENDNENTGSGHEWSCKINEGNVTLTLPLPLPLSFFLHHVFPFFSSLYNSDYHY